MTDCVCWARARRSGVTVMDGVTEGVVLAVGDGEDEGERESSSTTAAMVAVGCMPSPEKATMPNRAITPTRSTAKAIPR